MSKKTKDPWVRIIDVSEPFLHEKGYTLYKVTSKVFPKNSVEAVTEVTVWKRYNDFKKLHKALSTLHQNLYLKETFPPFAKTQFFGRFDPAVIEERRKSALALLQFAANCSPLFTSQVFVKFFEDGHLVDKSKQTKPPQFQDNCDILQPQRNEFITERNSLHAEIIEQKLCPSTEESDGQENHDPVRKEPFGSLGGIWQHHQVPDNISLGSHGTDDDDHTTFTDDDTTVSRTSINLSEFDPLLAGKDEVEQKLVLQENLCNSWLLSALESCTSSTDVEKDLENILEFPTPFHDFEDSSVNECLNSANFISNAKDSHFPFDNSVPNVEESPDNSGSDTVLNNSLPNTPKDVFHDEDDSNYDKFAMTPNAYDKEPQHPPSYIIHASEHVKLAQTAEAESRYKEAFELYKKAIDILLQGFQKDKSPELKEIVRKKILFYLMRAEELYENKLPKETLDVKSKIEKQNVSLSPGNIVSKLQGNVQELEKYKVLGVLDKVLLVLDITTNNTYIVKTLYKSSNPKIYGMTHIVPQNVPFMVKLYRIYETNYALFLILEHATGGRLWDYVSSFLQRSPLSPCNDGTCLYVESKTKADLCNVYSGKKVYDDKGAENGTGLADLDFSPSENCSSSYVALFQKYADAVDQENVPLAKYHKQPGVSKSKASGSIDMAEAINDINNKMSLLQPQKPIRNRLSSSTGSLETTFSQKPTNLDALTALETTASQASSKTHLPESCINLWAAEIILALESLHDLGIIWMDFHPNNIMLGAEGHILLTYQSQWKNIDFVINKDAKENLYCAPEVGNIFPVSSDCDWWSLGAILFELLTGQSLVSCHPTGITRHTVLNFPTEISSNAKDFISKLLQYNPTERLGSGIYGIEEIKSHPFMREIDWKALQR